MGLFKKFKKKKTEVIDLNLMNQIINEEKEIEKEVLISNTKEEKIEENIDLNIILKKNKEISKDFELTLHEYFTCKIFSRVALKDNEFNAQLIEIDKYINTIKRSMYEIDRLIEGYKRDNNLDLININNKLNDLYLYEKNIKSRFLEMNNSYYGHIKMSTISVCMNKDNESLERFYESIHAFLLKYKGFTEAAEDIYYSSGDFLVDLVSSLVMCIKETRREDYIKKYNFNYFLDSDVIITLEVKEWINLFAKIRFAMKLIQNIEMDKYLNFKFKFDHFEMIYTILMMRYEIASSQGRDI